MRGSPTKPPQALYQEENIGLGRLVEELRGERAALAERSLELTVGCSALSAIGGLEGGSAQHAWFRGTANAATRA